MKLHFVTGNRGKADEARQHLAPLGIDVEAVAVPTVEMQADRLEEVAHAKAEVLRNVVPHPYFVEDAGLFVDALKGFPGVYSSHAFRTIGNAGILRLLSGAKDRSARFRAVIAYIEGDEAPRLFSGECAGRIASRAAGTHGFGFDPIFAPKAARRTFAQVESGEKSRTSHRARALDALARFLTDSRVARQSR